MRSTAGTTTCIFRRSSNECPELSPPPDSSWADVQLLPEEALPARRYLSIYQLDTEDLAGTAQALGSALGDGTLDMSEAIATTGDTGPELLFYVPTEN